MRTKIFAMAMLVGACGSDAPADVAGDYSVNITNGPNDCGFDNWMDGASSTGISVVITQTNSDANVSVNGLAGGYLDLILGSHVFVSSVDGSHVDGQIIGTRSGTKGNCTYQLTTDLTASLSHDTLTGKLTHTPTTNHASDCGVFETCANVQNFNGLRPPK